MRPRCRLCLPAPKPSAERGDAMASQISDAVVPIHINKEGQLPSQLSRLWCLYEIMRARDLGKDIDFSFTSSTQVTPCVHRGPLPHAFRRWLVAHGFSIERSTIRVLNALNVLKGDRTSFIDRRRPAGDPKRD
jgi:hypothetical protein